jgi:site-specific DNA-methyltransferase (adenine-specific)
MRSHEMIYVFSKAGAYYNRMDIANGMKERSKDGYIRTGNMHGAGLPVISKKKNPTDRCVVSVIQTHTSAKKGNHPTEKPEALYRFLIERYCPVGGMVLDPTFGSGNSVFTAFAMGRSAIGIEQDETFFKKAEERLNALP